VNVRALDGIDMDLHFKAMGITEVMGCNQNQLLQHHVQICNVSVGRLCICMHVHTCEGKNNIWVHEVYSVITFP
jgi:hypothetical protein